MDFMARHRGNIQVLMFGAPTAFHRECPPLRTKATFALFVHGHDPVPRALGSENLTFRILAKAATAAVKQGGTHIINGFSDGMEKDTQAKLETARDQLHEYVDEAIDD